MEWSEHRQWLLPRLCCLSLNNPLAHIPHPPRFGGPEMRFYWGNGRRRTIAGGQGSGTQPSKQGSSLRRKYILSVSKCWKFNPHAKKCLTLIGVLVVTGLDWAGRPALVVGGAMRALQRADGLGSPPGVGDIHLSYRLSHLGPEMKDSLYRGSSFRAGSSIGCHCSAKAFTVTSDLETIGRLLQEEEEGDLRCSHRCR